ncbi:MAG: class I SAM-dependent methyltransferase [Acidobacteriota bacterium]
MNPAEFTNIATAEDRMWWFAGMRKILQAWIGRMPEQPSGRVLEAGCGTGYMSRWLAENYGWRMFPLDLDFSGLAYARREGTPRLNQADLTSLPYRDGVFDAVVSLDVLVHLPEGQETQGLAEFLRVLKPGGILLLRVSALRILRSRHSEFAHEQQRFTRSRLKRAVRQAGFQLIDASYANSLLLPVAVLKFRIWEPLTRQAPASGVVVPSPLLNWALRQPLEWEARWLEAGGRLPLGQSVLLLAQKVR